MILKGTSVKIGDNINTDLIISGRYKFAITDMKELSKYLFEDVDPNFGKKIVAGKSIIVAGDNFGCGSSREQAPLVIKEAGIVCIIARSFARIFYRNAFNIGLALIEADTSLVEENDELEVDLENSAIKDITKNKTLKTSPLPKIMRTLLSDGGLVAHVKKNNGINL